MGQNRQSCLWISESVLYKVIDRHFFLMSDSSSKTLSSHHCPYSESKLIKIMSPWQAWLPLSPAQLTAHSNASLALPPPTWWIICVIPLYSTSRTKIHQYLYGACPGAFGNWTKTWDRNTLRHVSKPMIMEIVAQVKDSWRVPDIHWLLFILSAASSFPSVPNNGAMGWGTGDEGLYIMVHLKNRCSGDDSVVFSHHSPWFIVVCTLSQGLVMCKHAHKHANICSHVILRAAM